MFFLLLLGLSRSRRPVSFAALPLVSDLGPGETEVLALARHYGFKDEGLDFITHYDIKYRMGQDAGEADEG